jgi:hypothetical protein
VQRFGLHEQERLVGDGALVHVLRRLWQVHLAFQSRRGSLPARGGGRAAVVKPWQIAAISD